MSTRFLGAGGGELGESLSASRARFAEVPLVFLLLFGVEDCSSSWEPSSPSSLLSLFWSAVRHSSVECPFSFVEGEIFARVVS